MIYSEAKMIQRFSRDGVQGIFLYGIGEQGDYSAPSKGMME